MLANCPAATAALYPLNHIMIISSHVPVNEFVYICTIFDSIDVMSVLRSYIAPNTQNDERQFFFTPVKIRQLSNIDVETLTVFLFFTQTTQYYRYTYLISK